MSMRTHSGSCAAAETTSMGMSRRSGLSAAAAAEHAAESLSGVESDSGPWIKKVNHSEPLQSFSTLAQRYGADIKDDVTNVSRIHKGKALKNALSLVQRVHRSLLDSQQTESPLGMAPHFHVHRHFVTRVVEQDFPCATACKNIDPAPSRSCL